MAEKNSGCWICKLLLVARDDGSGYKPYPMNQYMCNEIGKKFTPDGDECKHCQPREK